MKAIYTILLSILCFVLSAQNIDFYKKSGVKFSVNLNEVQNLWFTQTPNAINLTLKDNNTLFFLFDEIDSTLFGSPANSSPYVKDIEGNTYLTVIIGSQVWMAENLKVSKYNDSTNIPLVSDNTAWSNLSTSGFCWFNNDYTTYGNKYGALYNWYTINTAKLCPTNWHVPSDAEWSTLEVYLQNSSYNYDGIADTSKISTNNKIAKSLTSNIYYWPKSTNIGAVGNTDYPLKRNTTGFTALPKGNRYLNGTFTSYLGIERHCWWSTTSYLTDIAFSRSISYQSNYVERYTYNKKGGYSVRCVRDLEAQVNIPSVNTSSVDSITKTTAIIQCEVTVNGGATLTARGVCWSTNSNPTIYNDKTIDGTGVGSFSSKLTGLTAGATYYVRAYATNSQGTAYGSQQTFTTQINSVTDVDGNVYNIVTIGDQIWMKENLKVTKYNDGTTIPLVTDSIAWSKLTSPGYCWYNNDKTSYKNLYGALYNVYAVNSNKLCPMGWHVSSDDDWLMMDTYLRQNRFNYDDSFVDDKYAKALASSTGWYSLTSQPGAVGNTDYPLKRNITGFTARPGGSRSTIDGSFYNAGYYGMWWRGSDNLMNMWYSKNYLDILATGNYSASVRCVKD